MEKKNISYFKSIHIRRVAQQRMAGLRDTSSTNPDRTHTNQKDMEKIAHRFYQNFYTSDPVAIDSINQYSQTIPFDRRLNDDDKDELMECITSETLQHLSKRSPRQSSPGSDGLDYAYLHLLFSLPTLESLVEEVYNDAFTKGIFPLHPGRIFG